MTRSSTFGMTPSCGRSWRPNDQLDALTETGWHDGHERAMRHFPGIVTRREWWYHVLCEIDAAGIPLECACWFPFLDTAWEPGEAWPNGWRG